VISREEIPFDGEGKGRARPVQIIHKDPPRVVALNGSVDGKAIVKALEQVADSLKLVGFHFL
jgi:hypothetical protein